VGRDRQAAARPHGQCREEPLELGAHTRRARPATSAGRASARGAGAPQGARADARARTPAPRRPAQALNEQFKLREEERGPYDPENEDEDARAAALASIGRTAGSMPAAVSVSCAQVAPSAAPRQPPTAAPGACAGKAAGGRPRPRMAPPAVCAGPSSSSGGGGGGGGAIAMAHPLHVSSPQLLVCPGPQPPPSAAEFGAIRRLLEQNAHSPFAALLLGAMEDGSVLAQLPGLGSGGGGASRQALAFHALLSLLRARSSTELQSATSFLNYVILPTYSPAAPAAFADGGHAPQQGVKLPPRFGVAGGYGGSYGKPCELSCAVLTPTGIEALMTPSGSGLHVDFSSCGALSPSHFTPSPAMGAGHAGGCVPPGLNRGFSGPLAVQVGMVIQPPMLAMQQSGGMQPPPLALQSSGGANGGSFSMPGYADTSLLSARFAARRPSPLVADAAACAAQCPPLGSSVYFASAAPTHGCYGGGGGAGGGAAAYELLAGAAAGSAASGAGCVGMPPAGPPSCGRQVSTGWADAQRWADEVVNMCATPASTPTPTFGQGAAGASCTGGAIDGTTAQISPGAGATRRSGRIVRGSRGESPAPSPSPRPRPVASAADAAADGEPLADGGGLKRPHAPDAASADGGAAGAGATRLGAVEPSGLKRPRAVKDLSIHVPSQAAHGNVAALVGLTDVLSAVLAAEASAAGRPSDERPLSSTRFGLTPIIVGLSPNSIMEFLKGDEVRAPARPRASRARVRGFAPRAHAPLCPRSAPVDGFACAQGLADEMTKHVVTVT
jgi:hypothetical protein